MTTSAVTFWGVVTVRFSFKCHGRRLPPNRCNLGGGSVWDVVEQPSSTNWATPSLGVNLKKCFQFVCAALLCLFCLLFSWCLFKQLCVSLSQTWQQWWGNWRREEQTAQRIFWLCKYSCALYLEDRYICFFCMAVLQSPTAGAMRWGYPDVATSMGLPDLTTMRLLCDSPEPPRLTV